jgi:hypothetical protein
MFLRTSSCRRIRQRVIDLRVSNTSLPDDPTSCLQTPPKDEPFYLGQSSKLAGQVMHQISNCTGIPLSDSHVMEYMNS